MQTESRDPEQYQTVPHLVEESPNFQVMLDEINLVAPVGRRKHHSVDRENPRSMNLELR